MAGRRRRGRRPHRTRRVSRRDRAPARRVAFRDSELLAPRPTPGAHRLEVPGAAAQRCARTRVRVAAARAASRRNHACTRRRAGFDDGRRRLRRPHRGCVARRACARGAHRGSHRWARAVGGDRRHRQAARRGVATRGGGDSRAHRAPPRTGCRPARTHHSGRIRPRPAEPAAHRAARPPRRRSSRHRSRLRAAHRRHERARRRRLRRRGRGVVPQPGARHPRPPATRGCCAS